MRCPTCNLPLDFGPEIDRCFGHSLKVMTGRFWEGMPITGNEPVVALPEPVPTTTPQSIADLCATCDGRGCPCCTKRTGVFATSVFGLRSRVNELAFDPESVKARIYKERGPGHFVVNWPPQIVTREIRDVAEKVTDESGQPWMFQAGESKAFFSGGVVSDDHLWTAYSTCGSGGPKFSFANGAPQTHGSLTDYTLWDAKGNTRDTTYQDVCVAYIDWLKEMDDDWVMSMRVGQDYAAAWNRAEEISEHKGCDGIPLHHFFEMDDPADTDLHTLFTRGGRFVICNADDVRWAARRFADRHDVPIDDYSRWHYYEIFNTRMDLKGLHHHALNVIDLQAVHERKGILEGEVLPTKPCHVIFYDALDGYMIGNEIDLADIRKYHLDRADADLTWGYYLGESSFISKTDVSHTMTVEVRQDGVDRVFKHTFVSKISARDAAQQVLSALKMGDRSGYNVIVAVDVLAARHLLLDDNDPGSVTAWKRMWIEPKPQNDRITFYGYVSDRWNDGRLWRGEKLSFDATQTFGDIRKKAFETLNLPGKIDDWEIKIVDPEEGTVATLVHPDWTVEKLHGWHVHIAPKAPRRVQVDLTLKDDPASPEVSAFFAPTATMDDVLRDACKQFNLGDESYWQLQVPCGVPIPGVLTVLNYANEHLLVAPVKLVHCTMYVHKEDNHYVIHVDYNTRPDTTLRALRDANFDHFGNTDKDEWVVRLGNTVLDLDTPVSKYADRILHIRKRSSLV